jgi:hypothetical protein
VCLENVALWIFCGKGEVRSYGNIYLRRRKLVWGIQLTEMLANGTNLPPLFCVPTLLKDNFDFMGTSSTAGMSALVQGLNIHTTLCRTDLMIINSSSSCIRRFSLLAALLSRY